MHVPKMSGLLDSVGALDLHFPPQLLEASFRSRASASTDGFDFGREMGSVAERLEQAKSMALATAGGILVGMKCCIP